MGQIGERIMPRFYNEEELDRIHKAEMGILKDFMKICDENGLKYFAFAGTGIGAIRHGGFIPWDDDIDVALPRKDFEKFIEIVERDMGDKYYVLNTERDHNFPLTSTRLCIRGTKFVEWAFMKVKCDFGIFLDIYPYDNFPDNEFLYFIQKWRAWILSKLLILRSVDEPVIFQEGIKGALVREGCKLAHRLLVFLRVDKYALYKRCMKICTQYNNRKTKRFGYPCDTKPDWNTLYKRKTFPCVKWKFEDVELNFPKDMKAMLHNFYGDTYMELPPVEKRKTHFPYILDFGDGERVVSKK